MRRAKQLLLTSVLVSCTALAASDISTVESIARYRSTKTELRITFDASSFSVLEGRKEPLSAGDLRRLDSPVLQLGDAGRDVEDVQAALRREGLLAGNIDGKFGPATRRAISDFQKAKGITASGVVDDSTWLALGLPTPRIGEWRQTESVTLLPKGKERRYRVNRTLEITSTESEGKLVLWTKTTFREAARYQLERWPEFLEAVVPQGLISYEALEMKDIAVVRLTFRADYEPKYPLGTASLSMPEDAYRFLKLSNQYAPRASSSGRSVVLIHEPHSDVAGQIQLVDGLRALALGNKDKTFKFLVEGDLPGGQREIPVKPLRELLSEDIGVRRRQVHFLLTNFLVDGPLAYRLLYDAVPAVAIDDPDALRRSPRRPVLTTQYELRDLMFQVLEKGPVSEDTQETASHLMELYTFGVRQGAGEQFIDLLADKANTSRRLASLLAATSASKYAAEIGALEKNAVDLDSERQAYSVALERDKTMARFIGGHFQTPDAERIPIAFIGSFHTAGILELLPPDMGYVVLEPRIVSVFRTDNDEKFNDALHDYSRAIDAAIGKLRKLATYPPQESLGRIRQIVDRVAATAEAPPIMAGGELPPTAIAAIRNAVNSNGFLGGARLELAGGGAAGGGGPPTGFEGAFAAFSMGPDGMGRKLMLFPERSRNWDEATRARWSSEGRLNYLQWVVLTPAMEIPGATKRVARKVTFFQDPATKVIFYSVFEPSKRAYFFFEADEGFKGSSILALPHVSRQNEIHLRLSQILRKLFTTLS